MPIFTMLIAFAAFAGPGIYILINGPFKYSGDTYYTYGGIDPIAVQNWSMEKIGIEGTAVALIAFGVLAAFMVYRGKIR